ncbi:hypothetical protein [Helcococcus massiliensis]|uniref:hypothetical protein n=1 Tax=Helcococcus massiliensis TaxID=2040290 RepID=UPI000CDF108A|nr:hypothetical protein [Helcococcus massiliensis]
MRRIPIRVNSRKNKPRILDYVCGDNGEEHIEYKVNQVVKRIKLSDFEGQIKAAKKVEKLK